MNPTAVTIPPATSTGYVDTGANMTMIVICVAIIAFIWLFSYWDMKARHKRR